DDGLLVDGVVERLTDSNVVERWDHHEAHPHVPLTPDRNDAEIGIALDLLYPRGWQVLDDVDFAGTAGGEAGELVGDDAEHRTVDHRQAVAPVILERLEHDLLTRGPGGQAERPGADGVLGELRDAKLLERLAGDYMDARKVGDQRRVRLRRHEPD